VGGTLDFNAGYNGDVQLSRIGQRLHFKSSARIYNSPSWTENYHEAWRLSRQLRYRPAQAEHAIDDVHLEDVSGSVEVENRNGLWSCGPRRAGKH